jgi:general secretion pathway protein A
MTADQDSAMPVAELAPQKPAGGENDAEETRALASPASGNREEDEEPVTLEFIRDTYGRYPAVFFGLNSNKLEDTAYDMLGQIASFYAQNPETIFILRGYTDKSGLRSYNLKLSEFRADMVKTYLVGKGVSAESITTMAIGPDPEGPGGTQVPYDGERRKVLIEIVSPNS